MITIIISFLKVKLESEVLDNQIIHVLLLWLDSWSLKECVWWNFILILEECMLKSYKGKDVHGRNTLIRGWLIRVRTSYVCIRPYTLPFGPYGGGFRCRLVALLLENGCSFFSVPQKLLNFFSLFKMETEFIDAAYIILSGDVKPQPRIWIGCSGSIVS